MNKSYFLALVLLFPVFLMAQSPHKLVEQGRYDEAIEESVKRLEKGKGNKDELYAALKHAYDFTNNGDLEKVKQLKASGKPDIWFDVFMAYFDMQKRYEIISPIEEQLVEDHVKIRVVDYSKDMEAARQNAAAYLYAHAVSLLKTGARPDAAKAYEELLLITKLYPEYQDVELQLRKAIGASAGVALLEYKNRSKASISPDFMADLESIVLTYHERQYLDYALKEEDGKVYPLLIKIFIEDIQVTPGTVNKKEYTTSHKNPESFETAYDNEDEKAKAKKHPDYNKCQITEIYQVKTAKMSGKLEYIDNQSGRLLYSIPITARAIFENKTATASGDMFACPPEIYDILDKPKKKFPKNDEMINRVGKEFKMLLKEVIWNEAFITK